MTLKKQERMFLSAILTLDIRSVQMVVTEYNRLKDIEKGKKELGFLTKKKDLDKMIKETDPLNESEIVG